MIISLIISGGSDTGAPAEKMGDESPPVQHDSGELPACTPPSGQPCTSKQREVIPNLRFNQVIIQSIF